MTNYRYNVSLTLKMYILAGVIFAIYGGRVCPMLETLTANEILVHVGITFTFMWFVRHRLSMSHDSWATQNVTQSEPLLFFIFSIPLALFYNFSYDFPIESNLKVLFGMTLFGFFTGTILQLHSKIAHFELWQDNRNESEVLAGQRESIVKQMIMMMALLLITLTTMLAMVALKDIFWLQHRPDRLLDGSGQLSVIKEFIYISFVLGGYAGVILYLWTKLMKKILLSQECSLIEVTQGNINTRLPVFEHNELGSMAYLTNQMLDSLQSSQDEVKVTRDVAIMSLSALAESRDNETGAHIMRTQEYVKALATELSHDKRYEQLLSPDYIELLYKSAPLHDVGKVGVPDNVLLKPGKLTEQEFEIMKQHPEIGAQALSMAEEQLGTTSFLILAKEISLTHHEKWNGSGYPNQLKGEDIPLSGRLMALADVYDALISKRVYKPAFSHEEARSIIIEGKGLHFDPSVVDAFIAIEEQFIQIARDHQD
ncbi:HD-GYP domain-containing protein [Vibrio genomosp. F10 str. 9ZC157]|uniref:Metal-dependent phosphohydrolase n=2 Tax=Vibrio genomosp. F10 TaxID=723171 RepID=A0A1E5BHY0_9VIBR|nr:HD domain-containing phosphohydrolase [Vibrio genomosp. F10]OEE36647.1 metal-dependent phosphohydrolase [Vibrio genomosp. F10 str. ZF-129]OEE98333.1 metal-dependent phosphohydrolase [Vibrio genomosp. F10 str. 9ZC157]